MTSGALFALSWVLLTIPAIIALKNIHISEISQAVAPVMVALGTEVSYKKPRPIINIMEILRDFFMFRFQNIVTGKTAKTPSVKADHAGYRSRKPLVISFGWRGLSGTYLLREM